MYTGGTPPQTKFRGPIPTNQEVPDGPPTSAPPPAPSKGSNIKGSNTKGKKSFRQSVVNIGKIKKKPPAQVRSSLNQKKSDSSLLSIAEKQNEVEKQKLEDGPPPKLIHHTAKRPLRGTAARGRGGLSGRPSAGGRRPPSRKPLNQRNTQLTTLPTSPDISLVAEKKPPPVLSEGLVKDGGAPVKPIAPKSIAGFVDEKEKEKEKIEREKKKSAMQKVGSKTVMRIFLDNKGTGFKTVAVPFPCNMYALCDIMRKKVFTDTVGFGIYEVNDGKDIRLIDPEEDVTDVMANWNSSDLSKFVFKKALGKYADLYLNPPKPGDKKDSTSDNKPLPGKPNKPEITPSMLSKPSMPSKPEPSVPPKPTMPSKPEPSMPPKPSMPSKPEPSMPPKPTMPSKPEPSMPPKPTMPSKPESSMPPKPSMPSKPSMPKSNGPPAKPRPLSSRRPPPGAPLTNSSDNIKKPTLLQTAGMRNSTGNMPRGRPQRRPPPRNPLTEQPKPKPEPTPPPKPVEPTPPSKPVEPTPPPKPVEPTPPSKPVEPIKEENTDNSSGGSYKSKPITEWTVEEVGEWISELGFAKMRDCFVENYISGLELTELTNSELKEDLGVNALGARKAILREIGKLKP